MAGTVMIVQGEDITLTVDLKNKTTGDPFNLTGFSGATAYFAPQTGTASVAVSGGLVSADLGRITFPVSEIQSAAMLSGDGQDFEVEVNQGAIKTIAQIQSRLTVLARLKTT